MEYVNSSLVIREDIEEEEDMLSHDLEELLTITPAPTNNFRSTISSYKQIQRDDNHQRCDSDNKVSCKIKTDVETKEMEKPFW